MFKKSYLISILTLLVLSSVFASFTKIFVEAQVASNMFSSFGGSKTQVVPGDTLEYVLTIRNDGTQNLNDVLVRENFRSGITLVSGTTRAEKNGSTITVPEEWTANGFNFGALNPGQTAYFKYEGKIPDNAVVGATLENAIDVRSNELEWVSQAHNVQVISINQVAALRGGNFLNITNVNRQNGWQVDGVEANIGETVEFLVYVRNDGQFEARNVTLKANFPTNYANSIQPSVTLDADNSDSVTDSVNIALNAPGRLQMKFGHARIFGNTGLYNCPNGCVIPESFHNYPLGIGTVAAGESATIQVIFKADVVGQSTATPTATPTSTPTTTPTATPTGTPTATPSGTPTSTPTATPTPGTQLKLCKYEDDNGNGQHDNGENVMSWRFRVTYDGVTREVDSHWWNIFTQGCVIVDVPSGKEIVVEEEYRGGWRITGVWVDGVRIGDGNRYQYTSEVDRVKVIWFLNTFTPGSTPTPVTTPTATPTGTPGTPRPTPSPVLGTTAPSELPKTGNEDLIFVGLSVLSTFVGLYLVRRFRLV